MITGVASEEPPLFSLTSEIDPLVTLPDVPVRNPAFDITPAELIAAIVTERGACPPAAVSGLLAAAR